MHSAPNRQRGKVREVQARHLCAGGCVQGSESKLGVREAGPTRPSTPSTLSESQEEGEEEVESAAASSMMVMTRQSDERWVVSDPPPAPPPSPFSPSGLSITSLQPPAGAPRRARSWQDSTASRWRSSSINQTCDWMTGRHSEGGEVGLLRGHDRGEGGEGA